jgi:hypothetical protein
MRGARMSPFIFPSAVISTREEACTCPSSRPPICTASASTSASINPEASTTKPCFAETLPFTVPATISLSSLSSSPSTTIVSPMIVCAMA